MGQLTRMTQFKSKAKVDLESVIKTLEEIFKKFEFEDDTINYTHKLITKYNNANDFNELE